MIVRWLATLALIAAPGLAQAQGSGCSGFKWPLDHERAALVRTDKASLPNGGAIPYDVAMTLGLQPLSAAGLPKAPERAPKSPSAFAGHFALGAPAKPGAYRITISSEGWVDVLDGGAYLHPIGFTGAKGLRRRAQERQVRPSRSAARGPIQRRPARSNLHYRFSRPIASAASSFDDVRVPYCPCALGRGSVSVGNAAYS